MDADTEALSPPFQLACIDHGAGRFELRIVGELDSATITRFQAALDAIFDRHPAPIAIDIEASELCLISASCVGVLLAAEARLPRGRLRMHHAPAFVQRVLHVCGVDRLVAPP